MLVLLAAQLVQQRGRLGSRNNWWTDQYGYYAYLPQFILRQDPHGHEPAGFQDERAFMKEAPRGRVNQYPPGVALHLLPFFAVAHAAAHLLHHPTDGYGPIYRAVVGLAPLCYVACALLLLRAWLRRFFVDATLVWVLPTLVLATNLFYYVVVAGLMAHAYLFFLFSAILYLTPRWYEEGRPWQALALGALVGWAVVTRYTAGVVALVPLLYGLSPGAPLRERLGWWWKRRRQVAAALATMAVPILLLMSYWHLNTGQFFYHSYGAQGLIFDRRPPLLAGLFSARNGWLLYTPVMAPALLGLWWLRRTHPEWFRPLVIFLVVNLYLVLSWHVWFYKGFGQRALIESYAPLALPLALTYDRLARGGVTRWLARLFLVTCVGLNLFQSYQFQRGLINGDRMSWAAYRLTFGRLSLTPSEEEAFEEHLHPEPDYQ
ncbi:MAG: hypothetical protein WBA12_15035 [Catalinimonas sp.]